MYIYTYFKCTYHDCVWRCCYNEQACTMQYATQLQLMLHCLLLCSFCFKTKIFYLKSKTSKQIMHLSLRFYPLLNLTVLPAHKVIQFIRKKASYTNISTCSSLSRNQHLSRNKLLYFVSNLRVVTQASYLFSSEKMQDLWNLYALLYRTTYLE